MLSTRTTGQISQKALKTMGLSVQDLFDNFMGTRAGFLPRNEFDIFWQTVGARENSRDTLLMLRLFIKTLIEISIDNSRKLPEYPLQSILNTAFFMGLTLPLQADTLLKKMVSNWQGNIKAFRKDASVVGYEAIVAILTQRLCDETDALDLIIPQLHIMHSQETFQMFNDVFIPTFHRCLVPTPSPVFTYSWLLKQCTDKVLMMIFSISVSHKHVSI
jgi:hypothetical protein